jgi:hypothetical protein
MIPSSGYSTGRLHSCKDDRPNASTPRSILSANQNAQLMNPRIKYKEGVSRRFLGKVPL